MRKIKRKDKIFIAGVVIGVGVLLFVTRAKNTVRITEQVETNSLDTGSTGFTKIVESVVKFLAPTIPKQTGNAQVDQINNTRAFINTIGVPVAI